jgi:DNA-binding transcriptional MerR regulator
MNAADQLLSLEELASRVSQALRTRGLIGAQADARVSAAPDARTVRYYTTLGLLDRPGIEDRKAVYGPRHLLQLLAVKALQAAELPLAEIQQRLYGRSDGELEALIEAIANSRAEEHEPPQALSIREFTLAPGLRLLVEEGFVAPPDLTQLEELFRGAIAAPRRAPRGAGGKK